MAAAKALKKGGTGSSGATPVNNAKLKCPFDLDEIFKSDTERFGQLQDVIKFIIDNLGVSMNKIENVDIKMQSKFMEISQ